MHQNGQMMPKPPAPQVLVSVNDKLRVFVTESVDKVRLVGMLTLALEQAKNGPIDGLISETVFEFPEERKPVIGNEADVNNEVNRQRMMAEALKG